MKTRLDWLEDQLDRDDLADVVRSAYEKEASKLADIESAMQERRVAYQRELQLKVNQIKELYEGGSRRELVRLYGHEFIDDYEIRKEGNEHIVYSSVARDFQNARWVEATEQGANEKIVELLGHRVYDHYVRDRS
jgi:hypothetical protein